MVRLPLNQVSALAKINTEISKFEQTNQRKPSADEIAAMTNLDQEKIQQTIRADHHHMSIDAPFSEDDDNSMADLLSSGDDSRTDKTVDHESMATDLDAVMEKVLKPREMQIVEGVSASRRRRKASKRLVPRWVSPANE